MSRGARALFTCCADNDEAYLTSGLGVKKRQETTAGCLGRGLFWRLSDYQLLAIPEAQGNTQWLKQYTSMDTLNGPMAATSATAAYM